MRPQEIIEKKRDGRELSANEIHHFIDGVCDGSWADYQISALVMAIFIRGLSDAEGETLTREMLYSGEVLDFSDIDAPKADKHSTGGVGDKTSLLIAPIVAACGATVPMISGRGLGHTGGTLDKLESIPGYNVNLPIDEFKQVIRQCGFAMSGQTAEIAPADKKLYALRDATATVPYIPLIVASIMSKKLAEGLDALVLDVKTGSGAFMQQLDDSRRLAKALVETGGKFDVMTEAVISDMGQPLGQFVGNAVEVYECVKILRGETDGRAAATEKLSIDLAARMILLTGLADTIVDAVERVTRSITDGTALERLKTNIECQGGDPSICDDPEKLLAPDVKKREVRAVRSGYVSSLDTLAIGNAISAIGGGRRMAEDTIDHAIGYECVAGIGDKIADGDVLGVLICRDELWAGVAANTISAAYSITDSSPPSPVLIHDVISS